MIILKNCFAILKWTWYRLIHLLPLSHLHINRYDGQGEKERRRLALLRDQYRTELIILNEDIKKSNASLEQTNKNLQETLAEKESFILRFSHEIRNLLNSLLGNVELCQESATSDPEDRKMLKDAKVSGEIFLQLLNNILDSTKISTKRLEVNIQLHDVREFCE